MCEGGGEGTRVPQDRFTCKHTQVQDNLCRSLPGWTYQVAYLSHLGDRQIIFLVMINFF